MRVINLASAVVVVLLLVVSISSADVNDIKVRGMLQVCVEAGGTGAIVSKDAQGHTVGNDADISALIAKELGVGLEFVDVEWAGIIPALLAKRCDMILSGMTSTKARAERVNFSVPYGDSSFVLVTRADDNRIASPKDLSGKIIAVEISGPGPTFLKGEDSKLKAAGLPPIKEVRVYDNIPEMFVDLGNKRTDGLLMPHPIVLGYMAKSPGTFKVATAFHERSYFCVAIRKEDLGLLVVTNRVLRKAKADGTLERLQIKWFGGSMGSVPDEWVPQE